MFTRTRDFVEDFASSLDLLDECFLLDIYPSRELPIEGVNSLWLLNKMKLIKKQVISKEAFLEVLKKNRPELLLTMGAGDIDNLVIPIETIFND